MQPGGCYAFLGRIRFRHWLGRRQAFGMMAGKASAADAECLRRIRDQKMYKSKTSSWGEFCERYLGASKTHVNRMIR
jgi:hypothetical protein